MNAQKKSPLSPPSQMQGADWNDIHVAYQVALNGTLTAAAEALDVHHSTVLRRVNALEKQLDTQLFHRHARGYSPTEAGKMLMQVAENTQNDFDLLFGQLQGKDSQLSGTLIITTVDSMTETLIPLLAEFQKLYPDIKLEFRAEGRILKLEYGEAHVSIRPGKPKDPDYVVQALAQHAITFYGSKAYVKSHGLMNSLNDIEGHRFISTIDPYSIVNFMEWLNENIPPEQIHFRANSFSGFVPAIKAGFGAAQISCWVASKDKSLVPLLPPPKQWIQHLWLVTHRDMHRTSKVQAFTQFIKQRCAKDQSLMLGESISA